MIRLCGHLLLWVGFLVGAFVSVRYAEVSEDPWSTVPWPSYTAALVVALAGVVALRATKRPLDSDSEDRPGAVDELVAILDRLHKTLDEWNVSSTKISVYDFHGMIDQQLAADLGRFADLREVMIGEFGLDRYAQVMTEFALAERTINRIWSASADGYVDEVQICLTRAVAHLVAARQRLGDAIADRDRAAAPASA